MQNLLHRPLSVLLLHVTAILCVAIAVATMPCSWTTASNCFAIGTRLDCRLLLEASDDGSQPLYAFFQICICG